MRTNRSMIMSRSGPLLRYALILRRTIQHHPPTKLARLAAEDVLPRRLALGHLIATLPLHPPPSLPQFVIRHQEFHQPLVEVDAQHVAVAEQREVSARRGLG